MKLIPSLLPICALLLPCALAAETFEGKVSMKMTSPSQKDGSQTMNMSIKEGFMRIDVEAAKGAGAMIMDYKNQQMIVLMPAQRMYMVQPMPQPGANPQAGGYPQAGAASRGPAPTLEVTSEKETILGYECTKYTATGQQGTAQLWLTDQLGAFNGLFHGGGPGQRPQAPQAWESALKGKGFFPMRVISNNNGKEFRLDVTSVEKTSLPASLFAPPEGWRRLDLGAMMGGAMPGGFPGARPDGSN
jgi:Domain of unknown function (DUF4412)